MLFDLIAKHIEIRALTKQRTEMQWPNVVNFPSFTIGTLKITHAARYKCDENFLINALSFALFRQMVNIGSRWKLMMLICKFCFIWIITSVYVLSLFPYVPLLKLTIKYGNLFVGPIASIVESQIKFYWSQSPWLTYKMTHELKMHGFSLSEK